MQRDRRQRPFPSFARSLLPKQEFASCDSSRAGAVPLVLVRSPRRSRTPPRPHGPGNKKEEKEKEMTDRAPYAPGPARGADIRKNGEKWTLILVRELRHPPDKVWQALTDPAHL